MSVLAIIIVLAVLAAGYWLFIWHPKHPSHDGTGPPTTTTMGDDGTPARRWDEVLGVSPSATVAEIRAANARLMRTLGPEQIAALEGEAKQQAEREALAVSNALRRGLQVRGGDG